MEVPRPIFYKTMGPVIYSKRAWDIAFDVDLLIPTLIRPVVSPPETREVITLPSRQVARALFMDQTPIDHTFSVDTDECT